MGVGLRQKRFTKRPLRQYHHMELGFSEHSTRWPRTTSVPPSQSSGLCSRKVILSCSPCFVSSF